MPEAIEKTIATLIVDDHALFRESLVRLLCAERGFEVVAHCGSSEEALRVLQKKQVDVVLLDRKSTRLNSSHGYISYAVFCLKKKKIFAARRHAEVRLTIQSTT